MNKIRLHIIFVFVFIATYVLYASLLKSTVKVRYVIVNSPFVAFNKKVKEFKITTHYKNIVSDSNDLSNYLEKIKNNLLRENDLIGDMEWTYVGYDNENTEFVVKIKYYPTKKYQESLLVNRVRIYRKDYVPVENEMIANYFNHFIGKRYDSQLFEKELIEFAKKIKSENLSYAMPVMQFDETTGVVDIYMKGLQ